MCVLCVCGLDVDWTTERDRLGLSLLLDFGAHSAALAASGAGAGAGAAAAAGGGAAGGGTAAVCCTLSRYHHV